MCEVVSETDWRLLMVSCSRIRSSASACDMLKKVDDCCKPFQYDATWENKQHIIITDIVDFTVHSSA